MSCLGTTFKVAGIKPGAKERVTVLLVSSSLCKENQHLACVKIVERTWPGNDNAPGYLEEGNKETETLVRVFNQVINRDNNAERLPLQLVHITVKRERDKFPIIALLKYVLDNSSQIDVFVVPNFSLENGLTMADAQEAINLLKQIKETTVVICASVRHNDIPTREVIAVGVIRGQQNAGEVYGATDFVVDIGLQEDLTKGLKYGPSTVAGVAASYICLLKLFSASLSETIHPTDPAKNDIEVRDLENGETLWKINQGKLEDGYADPNSGILSKIKSTEGMRQILLEILHKKIDPGKQNPAPHKYGFGKLESSDLKLHHNSIIEYAVNSWRRKLQPEIAVEKCMATEQNQDKDFGILQLAQEISNVWNNEQDLQRHKVPGSTIEMAQLKDNKKPTIKIAIVGRGIGCETNQIMKLSDGHIQPFCGDNEDQCGLRVMQKVVSVSTSENIINQSVHDLSDYVGVQIFSVYDENLNPKWDEFGRLLETIKGSFDVIHIYGTTSPPRDGYQISKKLISLKEESVVITCPHHNTLPANFPSESAISVGSWVVPSTNTGNTSDEDEKDEARDNDESVVEPMLIPIRQKKKHWRPVFKCSSGSKTNLPSHEKDSKTSASQSTTGKPLSVIGGPLDFLAHDDNKHRGYTGSYYATITVGLLILRAQVLGIPEDKIRMLRKTQVMHGILKSISSHPDRHSATEGWGVIHPWKLLKDKDLFMQVIDKYTAENKTKYFWAGKNI